MTRNLAERREADTAPNEDLSDEQVGESSLSQGGEAMRKSITRSIVALLAALALSQIAMAQGRGGRPLPAGFVAEGVPKMPNPPGPAPTRDLSGAWVGPQNYVVGPIPAAPTVSKSTAR